MREDNKLISLLILIPLILFILIISVVSIGNAYDKKVKRDHKYEVEDVLKVDTIKINQIEHEVLLINVRGERKIIHSPKCKCNEE